MDDGLATGATMLAAALAVKAKQPKRLIVAVPVASHGACEEFRQQVDDVILCGDTGSVLLRRRLVRRSSPRPPMRKSRTYSKGHRTSESRRGMPVAISEKAEKLARPGSPVTW